MERMQKGFQKNKVNLILNNAEIDILKEFCKDIQNKSNDEIEMKKYIFDKIIKGERNNNQR